MSEVTYEREGQLARIHIDGAGRENRFTMQLRRELHEALHQYRNDEGAWVAVVSAAGTDFCLGSDDDEPATRAERRERRALWAGGYVETWKPIIAAIQGQCRGEGFAFVLGCDLRVAAADTVFAADITQTTDVPDVSAAWLLNLVGVSATFELLWLGGDLDADEGQRIGLVNRMAVPGPEKALPAKDGRFPMEAIDTTICTPDGDPATAAIAFAHELLLYAPVTRTFQKEIAYRSIGVPFHYAQTLELGPNPYASEDRIEGTRAFVERRRPVWRNR